MVVVGGILGGHGVPRPSTSSLELVRGAYEKDGSG